MKSDLFAIGEAEPRLSTGRPLIVDSFAGGGGASTGIEMALGRSPDIAINHNAAALALHAANHPDTLHLSENIYRVDPLDYVRGRHVGLAHFSPDCKHFSKAKGGKPVERNIRDLAWVVVLWAERVRPDVITMENVEEWKDWGPLIETEKGLMPDPERRGETYQQWCKALRRLGYKIDKREIRACDYGAPTIRKRLFLVARCDGKPIVWPEPTHGAPDHPDVIAGRKLPWRTAAECIDWSLPCPSIFDTAAEIFAKHGLRAIRPLADATMARVARGMGRYVIAAKRPFLVGIAHGDSGGRREYGLDEPLTTVQAGGGKQAVVAPSVIRFNTGATGQDLREPLSTITANSYIKRPGGAAPLGIIAPHLMTMRNSGKPFNGADEPTHTITAGGAGLTLVAPHLSAFYGAGEGGQNRAAPADEPLRVVTTENRHAVIAPVLTAAQHGGSVRSPDAPCHTITASQKDQNAVIVPTLVGCGGRAGQSRPRGGDEPMATITAKADACAAVAFLAQQNSDPRTLGSELKEAPRPGRPADAPLSTVTASGSQQSVVSAFVARQFGASVGHGIEEPSATVTAGVNKSQLIAPYLQAYYGTGDGARLDEPARTVTTKDRHGHVEASFAAPPFTREQEARARQVAEFLRAHGVWTGGEFVTLDIDGHVFVIVDIGMRMLAPRELYNAQGFPPDYVIDGGWDQQGDQGPIWVDFPKSVQVSCVGNSVSPPPYAAIVAANCGHLAIQREAAE
ncbi:C-5 cytosine-specific DNA methylase [Rhizobium rhizosphaerae]|uniref:DNA (cytosine-5-)-methyltransferase n=1 Tax=Xaviernesmea rhizosphaerae TaxID=1672749 RepID=A0A1Q9AN33_9HYPH|nr:DNA cytosine methyltransferase [Xaviernesmea rhizosphaerae]OLP56808.1 C-5 cytosine-specific DNA methylase [Xaviernesmea rhizosphaerae]